MHGRGVGGKGCMWPMLVHVGPGGCAEKLRTVTVKMGLDGVGMVCYGKEGGGGDSLQKEFCFGLTKTTKLLGILTVPELTLGEKGGLLSESSIKRPL